MMPDYWRQAVRELSRRDAVLAQLVKRYPGVALVSRGGGPVSPETARAVEDAILTRARELRVQDGRF